MAAATNLPCPPESAERERRTGPGVAAGRDTSFRPFSLFRQASWRRLLVVGVFFPGSWLAVQVGVRLEHLAHELHQAGGLRGALQGGWQGRDLVLDGPHEELPEAPVGKAGVLQGVLDPVPLLDDGPEFFVQLFDALGRPGVSPALALQRPLDLEPPLLQGLDALLELTLHVERRSGLLFGLPDQLRGAGTLAGK